jgi:hypothetical protein
MKKYNPTVYVRRWGSVEAANRQALQKGGGGGEG